MRRVRRESKHCINCANFLIRRYNGSEPPTLKARCSRNNLKETRMPRGLDQIIEWLGGPDKLFRVSNLAAYPELWNADLCHDWNPMEGAPK